MPFNSRKLNSVRLYDKEVNLSHIGLLYQNSYRYTAHTMHFQWGSKPPNCPFLFGLRHPAGVGPSHFDRQHAQKIGKDRACGSGDMLAE